MKKFKKFINMINFMDMDLSARSYKSALIRIAVSLLTMLAVCLIRFNISITNPVINILSTLIILLIMIFAILCFFVAVVECLQVGDNIKKDKMRK